MKSMNPLISNYIKFNVFNIRPLIGMLFTALSFCCLFGSFAQLVEASGKGYVPGSEGVLGASVPPPGVHWRTYNIYYDADTLNDSNGDKIKNDFDLGIFAQAHRFVWITDKELFGANYGSSIVIPMVAIDFEIGAASLKDSQIGLGDIFIEPLVLGWHADDYDIALGLGINLSTGEYDSNEPASVGNGYWSSMLSFGGTLFFDPQKSLSASILSRTLYYGEQKETDRTPGAEFIFEYGIGKEMPISEGFLLRPGIVGYGLWQVNEDSGPGTSNEKSKVYAIGAEVNLFWLPPSLFQANLRTLFEFGAENEAEGTKTVLTITKSF